MGKKTPLRELSGQFVRITHVNSDVNGTEWMLAGNCQDYSPSTFFPSDGVGVDAARAICQDCPVKDRCREYALAERIEHGVWGGCSERERRRILKRRKLETISA